MKISLKVKVIKQDIRSLINCCYLCNSENKIRNHDNI